MIYDVARKLWNVVGIYRARHPLIAGMWFVGGRMFRSRMPTEEEQFLLGLSLVGKVVYDVGANVGIMTLYFARAVGAEGQVVAFEPHPYSFQRLTRNVRVNRLRNVRLVNKGLGAEQAALTLYQPAYHLSAATLNSSRAANLDEGRLLEYRVEIDTLDSVISMLNLSPPEMIKIDVEGFEEQVLCGGSETIRRYEPDLFIEIHRVAEGASTAPTVMQLLSDLGYSFYHVETHRNIGRDDAQSVRGGHIFCQPRR